MKCETCQHNFDERLDGRLDAATETLVQQHLADCPTCAAAWSDLESLWNAFQSVPEIEPSSNFVARVMQQIDREDQPQPARSFFFQPVWRWAVAAAMAAIVLVAGTNYWQKSPVTTQPLASQNVSSEINTELTVVQNLDLLTDFDVIKNLDRLAPAPAPTDEVDELLSQLWNS